MLRTQNVSEQNQKHFLCPGHKICVSNKCCARGQTGKHLCRQQCVGNNVSSFASTFIQELIFLKGNQWQTRTHCFGHNVAHDVSWAAQTGKHLLLTQNVSEQNQKHFLCPGHKICVRNKCCARGQTGKHLCRQQCVRNNVSAIVFQGLYWHNSNIATYETLPIC